MLAALILAIVFFSIIDLFRKRSDFARGLLLWAGVSLVAAAFCRQLDSAHRFSGPHCWIQGHALWHVLSAVTLFLTYLYARSEHEVRA